MTSPTATDRAWTAYWALWALCTVLASAVILVPDYLPMVDLPQHAGQIAIWVDWHNPDLRYEEVYRRGRIPPAFVATAVSFALAHVMSVEMALKIVITTTNAVIPILVRRLVQEVGGDPWWAFLSFPIAFGFSFGYGFINFHLGIPVALLLVLLAIRYCERPSRILAASLFVTALLLFAIHALAFGFGVSVSGSIILARSRDLRSAILRAAPLILVVPVTLAWLVMVRQTEPMTQLPWSFRLGLHRLAIFPSYLIGEPMSPLVIFETLMMLGVPFGCGARFSRRPWRWVMLTVSVALFLVAPHFILGTAFIYQRFAVFIIPGLLLALDWRPDLELRKRSVWPSEVAAVLALIVLCGVGIRLWRFNLEIGNLDEILTQIPRGARLLYLPVEPNSTTSPFPVYLHFGMWHQVRQGGVTDYSFARLPMNRFRFCESAVPALPLNLSVAPDMFDWDRDGGAAFDYFLVRSHNDSRKRLFKNAADQVSLASNRDAWWLFRRVGSARESAHSSTDGKVARSCANSPSEGP